MKSIPRLAELEHPLDPRVMPSQQMMMEIASGLEEPEHIAQRYGYTVKQFHQLAAQPYFQQQVVHYEAELRATGVTFARKTAMLAEDLAEDVYRFAKQSTDPDTVLKAAQWLAKMGRLEPVTSQRAESPSGNSGGAAVFQLSINLGGKKEEFVIEGAVTELLAVNNDLGVEDADSHAAGSGIG